MNNSEKEIQERAFESWTGSSGSKGLPTSDEQAYHRVFDALREEPEVDIPIDFAQVVTSKAIRRKKVYDFFRNSMFIGTICALLIFATSIVLYLISDDLLLNIWLLLTGFKSYILFGISIVFVIQAIDKMLITREIEYSI